MLHMAKKSILIYAAANDTNHVDVFDYSNGEQVGTISGFAAAAGCVDAKGNVYIVSGNGTALEYAHGGTQPVNSYSPGGDLVGCSVDARGDLAISASSPEKVTIYAKGSASHSATYSNGACEAQFAMGYDNKGDVIGSGQYESIAICAVLKGTRQEGTLSANGFTINFPNGSMWDGKYVELGDQEAGTGKGQTGLIQTTLSGTTLTSAGETILEDTCYRGYVDVLNPFVLGNRNTPLDKQQGKVVVGSNLYCASSDSQSIELWHYPAGGYAFKTYPTSEPVTVVAVSIGT
jgi:hypothetical protein